MTLSVYCAAPYEDAQLVRQVHGRLRLMGATVTSRWAEEAIGAEDFAKFTPSVLQAIAEANDADVAAANLVIVLARPGAGGEMFAECRYALTMRTPVYWTGRLTLSAWREGVTRFGSLEELLASVETLAGVVQP